MMYIKEERLSFYNLVFFEIQKSLKDAYLS